MYNSYEKMVIAQFVDLFKIKNFVLTLLPYLVYFGGKIEFLIFRKAF